MNHDFEWTSGKIYLGSTKKVFMKSARLLSDKPKYKEKFVISINEIICEHVEVTRN
jgi:hypothetical protein